MMMRTKWKLAVASLKMFFREREAVFWTFFLPLFLIFLFGFVKFDQPARLSVGLVNQAGSQSQDLVQALGKVQSLQITRGTQDEELQALRRGDRDLVVVIPADFRLKAGSRLQVYANQEKPREAQLATLLVRQTADERMFGATGLRGISLETEQVRARNLKYLDFLVPGILAMSIMQMGVFGVAFVFVDLKKRGILRRLRVTPINPNDFILAQVFTRLLILMLQICLLVAAGIAFFHFNFVGNLFDLFLLGVIGAVIFLAIGFALAGISKNEDQVAPLANLITLPMTLLSGVFFNRSYLPGFVHTVTDIFPLTYLTDGMRSVAIDGMGLGQILPQLAGLCVWAILSCIMAVKMFRWE